MVEMGQISLDVQYIDGTKIESVANKYTFVWRKSTETNKKKLEAKIQNILSQYRRRHRLYNQFRTLLESW